MRIIYFLFIISILASCSDNSMPREIIPPQKMQNVLWDYLSADIYTNDFIATDSTKNAVNENIRLQNLVFASHKISKEQFYKSYDYYLEHPGLMTILLDSMIAIQQRRHNKLPDTIKVRKKIKLKDLKVIE